MDRHRGATPDESTKAIRLIVSQSGNWNWPQVLNVRDKWVGPRFVDRLAATSSLPPMMVTP
jgi:hypothetical protein